MKRRLMGCTVWMALALPACGSSESEGSEERLLLWSQQFRYCGKERAVDRLGDVYEKQACEDGLALHESLSRVGTTDSSNVEPLRQAMQALPPAKTDADAQCLRHVFLEYDGSQRIFASVCGSGSGYDDLTGLAEPYAGVARRFLTLHE
jgi:hypothetical protein